MDKICDRISDFKEDSYGLNLVKLSQMNDQ